MLRSQLLLLTAMVMSMASGDKMLFKFDKPGDAREWEVVNDRVMGGVSIGRVETTKDGIFRFFGTVSLENNGGFASVRSLPNERDLTAYDGILIRIKGDGHRYAINLRTEFEVRAGSYRQVFEAHAGVWQQVFLPFADFQLTSFGQPIKDAPRLNTRKIRSVGFLISDKQAGPFELQVDWIRAAGRSFPLVERVVNAGCATCIFDMPGVEGCKLAVEIDSKKYLLDGSDIDDHGDAHASFGLCNTERSAIVSGELKDGAFLVAQFDLLHVT